MTTMTVDRQGSYAGNTGDPVIPACAPEAAVAGARVSSCTAVSLREDSDLHFSYTRKPECDPVKAYRRMGDFVDGSYLAVRRIARLLHLDEQHALDRLDVGYPEIRDFLAGECDCDPLTAQRIAFQYVSGLNAIGRKNRRGSELVRDRGWI